MEIKCDKCGAVTKTLAPDTTRDGEIEYTFFRCSECGAVYPIAATDDELRRRIGEYNHRRQLIRVKPVTEQFLRDTERIKQENINRNRELMELHPLALFLQPKQAE